MAKRSRDQQGDGYETGGGPGRGNEETGATDRDADRDIEQGGGSGTDEADPEEDDESDSSSAANAERIDLAGGRPGTGRSGDYNYDVDEWEEEIQGDSRSPMGGIETNSPRSVGSTGEPDDMSGTRGTSGASGNLADPASWGPGNGREE